jgi:hypothetical protein
MADPDDPLPVEQDPETAAALAAEAAEEAAVAHLAAPLPEATQPWERQPGETTTQWHAFTHFRELQVHSCLEAYRQHRRNCMHLSTEHLYQAPKHWRVWSSQMAWMDRALAWDSELDRQVRERLIKAQVEARERHARLAQAMLTVLSLPVKAALEAARDPELVQRLVASTATMAGTKDLMQQVARISSVVPGVVTMERLALGLTTDNVHVDDRDDDGISFADRIANDPAATDLAIQLLDRLVGPGQSPALGLGAPSIEGQVADSPAPEPPDPEAG